MPNWCSNEIRIFGSEEVLDEIWDELGGFNLDAPLPCIMDLYPMPAVLQGTRSPAPRDREQDPELYDKAVQAERETGFSNWYDWTTHHWGTKWPMDSASADYIKPTMIVFTGDTAWGPPIELYRRITEKYPVRLVTVFSEWGMDFVGGGVSERGEWAEAVEDLSNWQTGSFDDYDEDGYEEALMDAEAAARDEYMRRALEMAV